LRGPRTAQPAADPSHVPGHSWAVLAASRARCANPAGYSRPPVSLKHSHYAAKGGHLAKDILFDEFHLSVRAPPGLPDAEYDAMRLALDGKPFRAPLRRAARRVFGMFPALSRVRVEAVAVAGQPPTTGRVTRVAREVLAGPRPRRPAGLQRRARRNPSPGPSGPGAGRASACRLPRTPRAARVLSFTCRGKVTLA